MNGKMGFSSVTTGDVVMHGAGFSEWSINFVQLSPGRFEGVASELWLDGMQLFHGSSNLAVEHEGSSWPGSQVFLSYPPGDAEIRFGGRRFLTGSLIISRWDELSRSSSSGPFESIGFALDRSYLEDYVRKMTGSNHLARLLGPRLCKLPCVKVSRLQSTLREIFARASQSNAKSRAFAGLEAEVIMMQLLDILCAGTDGWDKWPMMSTREYIVSRAQEMIEENLGGTIHIADICVALRASWRTLDYSFQEVLNMTPLQYIMMRRLGAVRREIMMDHDCQSIRTHAKRWGFNHPGRFGQLYKSVFGENASDTRRLAL